MRPDQRLMEDGLWDEANAEKLRLEEKQRAVRRARENDAEKAADQGKFLIGNLLLNMGPFKKNLTPFLIRGGEGVNKHTTLRGWGDL